MATDSTLTREQLSTLFLNTELGGNTRHLDHFSYAKEGTSTYSFGLVQFDVGGNPQARRFLRDNGFSNGDIELLSQQGGLSTQQLAALDAKLQAIPQANIDQLTNAKLDSAIARVDEAITKVRASNPAAADAIVANPELQLAMADYDNQFGSMGPQFINYLSGNAETLQGGTIQAGDPPTRADVQAFVDATKYGIQSPAAVTSRDERFDTAMTQLGIAQTHAPSHGSPTTPGAPAGSGVLVNGTKGDEVQAMQQKLADLGYTGKDGAPLVADGHFGPGTLQAVQQFQRDHQLTVDGKAGNGTLGALDAASQQRQQQAEPAAPAAAPSMATPGHADHPRYQQVVEKLEALEQQRSQGGLSPLFHDRGQLENAAGQVAYESKVVGMSQVDTVVARPDGQGVFAVQGQLGDPAAHRTYIDLAQAVGQDLPSSTRQSEALNAEQTQRQAQEQAQAQAQAQQPMSR